MIAVFTEYRTDFEKMNCIPKKNFIYIKDERSVRGKSFTGIIRYLGWYRDERKCRAYEILERDQPELFKN